VLTRLTRKTTLKQNCKQHLLHCVCVSPQLACFGNECTASCRLYEYFRFNELAINFWLNHCVFPHETMQHPQKLVANAWHLVANPQYVHSEPSIDGCDDAHRATAATVHGFSGTNGNHRMLPLQVDYCCTCAKLRPR
jgi:hypothetical protein